MGSDDEVTEPDGRAVAVAQGRDAKPGWRRFAEVAVPVVVFAVAAPFVVNGLASAVSSPKQSSAATTTSPTTAPPSVAAPGGATTTIVAPTYTTVTIPGVNAGTDARSAALASEIIAEVPATTSAADPGVETATTPPATAADAAVHSHGVATPELPLTRAERADLAVQLSEARAAAMKYPTVADALAGGYVLITGYVPLIGAHYINWKLMDGTFDPNQPEMLLYDGTAPTSNIVGLSYYLFSDTPPSPFAGPNDHWHQHIGLCIKNGVVVGGESTTVAECTARGGTKANTSNGWMVHAWVVPGWESPQGVFSPEHPGLTADLPNS